MRYKFYIASLLVSIIFISSCSKTIKVTVYGSPGTEIRTPEKDYICTIDSSGTGIAEINLDYPYEYLLSKTPDSKQYIPFAMDWKKVSKDRIFLSAGLPGASVGVGLLKNVFLSKIFSEFSKKLLDKLTIMWYNTDVKQRR
mgnify:CR=1 FL=1